MYLQGFAVVLFSLSLQESDFSDRSYRSSRITGAPYGLTGVGEVKACLMLSLVTYGKIGCLSFLLRTAARSIC